MVNGSEPQVIFIFVDSCWKNIAVSTLKLTFTILHLRVALKLLRTYSELANIIFGNS